ncbi:multicopper oxidase domain-containing protein [Streptomyces sp. MAR4 CNY-716]
MPRNVFSRRSFTSGAAAAALATPVALSTSGATVTASDDKPQPQPLGEIKRITLYAEAMPDGQLGYGLEPGKPSIPGPLLEMYEGDSMMIKLVNNLDIEASLHVHGVDYDIDNDGTPMTNSAVPPGGSRDYVWHSHTAGTRRDGTIQPGSAGYWNYHDHAVGTPHGTGGVRRGLYGGLIVRRRGDKLPDKQFVIVFNDNTINNVAGHGPDFTATLGERCEIIMITHGEFYHTFHLHGHRWADNRTGMLASADDPTPIIDNKICGPGDSFGFQFVAGELVGSGRWMYHCHVQSHADMGMAGLLVVTNPNGTVAGTHNAEAMKPTRDAPAHGSHDTN